MLNIWSVFSQQFMPETKLIWWFLLLCCSIGSFALFGCFLDWKNQKDGAQQKDKNFSLSWSWFCFCFCSHKANGGWKEQGPPFLWLILVVTKKSMITCVKLACAPSRWYHMANGFSSHHTNIFTNTLYA